MSGELLDDLSLQPFEGGKIRKSVADRVKHTRSKFRLIPLQIQRFNVRLANDLRTKWEEENKIFRKENDRETPPQRLARWKKMAKRYRQYALIEASNRFYNVLRKLRSEIALIVAMYQFSEIDKLPSQQVEWKADKLDEFDSLILRMKGPRKPTKKKFGMKDLSYDVGNAYLDMMKQLENWANETKNHLDKLTAPRKKMKYKTKVKRFRNAVIAREYMTVLCQSLAPRQEGIKLMRTLESSENDEEAWLRVFDD